MPRSLGTEEVAQSAAPVQGYGWLYVCSFVRPATGETDS